MTHLLTHRHSPLEQTRRSGRVAMQDQPQGLSPEDQAALKYVLTHKYEYTPNEVFEKPNAYKQLFDDAPDVAKPDVSWYHPVMDSASKEALFAKKSLGSVLLTAAEERVLFLQFNYCRYRVCKIKDKVGHGRISQADAKELLQWYRRADQLREQIAQTNLALVLAMAKRTRMSEVDFGDLVSEGNMALLRAVDKFDVARGFKFSTYGCRAILKAFSRSGVKLSKYRSIFPTDFDPKLERSNYQEERRADHEMDCADEVRTIVQNNQADLTEIEQSVIEHRFHIGPNAKPPADDARPLTLEQVGKIIGVTKERVRQIQNKALQKIRRTLEEGYLG